MKQGIIKSWEDDRGYGFIYINDNNSVFFHISEYKHSKRPKVGDEVVFDVVKNEKGKLQAVNANSVKYAQQKKVGKTRKEQQSKFEKQQNNILVFSVVFYTTLLVLSVFSFLPWFIFIVYFLLGLVTFATYAFDKRAAQNDENRTPENTLHMLSIFGGWVGALLAQTFLRHKSKKTQFRRIYFLTIFINVTLLLAFIIYKINNS